MLFLIMIIILGMLVEICVVLGVSIFFVLFCLFVIESVVIKSSVRKVSKG